MVIMKNYDHSVTLNGNSNWCYISDHPSRMLIIVDSGSGKLMYYWA